MNVAFYFIESTIDLVEAFVDLFKALVDTFTKGADCGCNIFDTCVLLRHESNYTLNKTECIL